MLEEQEAHREDIFKEVPEGTALRGHGLGAKRPPSTNANRTLAIWNSELYSIQLGPSTLYLCNYLDPLACEKQSGTPVSVYKVVAVTARRRSC